MASSQHRLNFLLGYSYHARSQKVASKRHLSAWSAASKF